MRKADCLPSLSPAATTRMALTETARDTNKQNADLLCTAQTAPASLHRPSSRQSKRAHAALTGLTQVRARRGKDPWDEVTGPAHDRRGLTEFTLPMLL